MDGKKSGTPRGGGKVHETVTQKRKKGGDRVKGGVDQKEKKGEAGPK